MLVGEASLTGFARMITLSHVSLDEYTLASVCTYVGTAILTHVAIVHRHLIHSTSDRDHSITSSGVAVNLAKSDATVLIFGGHLLPFFNLGNTGASHSLEGIGDSLARLHVAQFNERNGNQARPTETTDRFGDKPFGIGLSDNNDGLASASVEFIWAFSLEVILDDTVDHSALALTEGGHSERSEFGRGRIGERSAVGDGETGVVVMVVVFLQIDGAPTIPFVFADDFEERDGDEAAGVRDERIAGFVPVGVVLSADHVEEIALAEGQFLGVGLGGVVVESFDHLEGSAVGGVAVAVESG